MGTENEFGVLFNETESGSGMENDLDTKFQVVN